jgi:hypothetical protein
MATTPKGKKPKLPSRSGSPNPNLYRIPVDVAPVVETAEERLMGVLGWILAVVLVAFMLPLLAFLYLDILETKHESKQQIEKVEKLRREIERKNRDKTPDTFVDNPVFDRVRKPLSVRMSRPDKLE